MTREATQPELRASHIITLRLINDLSLTIDTGEELFLSSYNLMLKEIGNRLIELSKI